MIEKKGNKDPEGQMELMQNFTLYSGHRGENDKEGERIEGVAIRRKTNRQKQRRKIREGSFQILRLRI